MNGSAGEKRSLVFAALGVAAIFLFPLGYFELVSLANRMPHLENEEELCKDIRGNGGYCYASYLDDGPIRFSILQSEVSSCCIVKRENLESKTTDHHIRVCAPDATQVVTCEAYETVVDYGTSYMIDGVLMEKTGDI